VRAARKAIKQEGIQTVISTSPPLATHMAALAVKLRHPRLKWIADFRDPLYGNPGRPRRWARPYDMALERMIFTTADYVIAVTDTVAEEWIARYPRMRHKFRTIWNGFDPDDALGPIPIEARSYRELVHVGVLYSQRHPYALIASLQRLIRRGLLAPHTFRLRFIGPIQERERFEGDPACAELIQQGVVEIHGDLIPRTEANRLISAGDFLLLIDIVNLSHAGYTVPAKLFDYILVGRPILALTDPNSPVDRILAKSGVPTVSLYHGEPDHEFDRKLLAFLQLPTDPVVPSPWFLENFDGRRQAESLAQLITSA